MMSEFFYGLSINPIIVGQVGVCSTADNFVFSESFLCKKRQLKQYKKIIILCFLREYEISNIFLKTLISNAKFSLDIPKM